MIGKETTCAAVQLDAAGGIMRRRISRRSIIRAILFAMAGAVTFTCTPGSVAFAQRGVGHPNRATHAGTAQAVRPLGAPRGPDYHPIPPISQIFAPPKLGFWNTPLHRSRLDWGF